MKSCAAPQGSTLQVSKSPQEACRTSSFIQVDEAWVLLTWPERTASRYGLHRT